MLLLKIGDDLIALGPGHAADLGEFPLRLGQQPAQRRRPRRGVGFEHSSLGRRGGADRRGGDGGRQGVSCHWGRGRRRHQARVHAGAEPVWPRLSLVVIMLPFMRCPQHAAPGRTVPSSGPSIGQAQRDATPASLNVRRSDSARGMTDVRHDTNRAPRPDLQP